VEGRPAGFANFRMTPTGSEPIGATCKPAKVLRESAQGSGAESGAVFDPDLARLVDIWPKLPDHVRRAILTLAD
jgi:hypothetical protein